MGTSATPNILMISIMKDSFGASIDPTQPRTIKRRAAAQSIKRRRRRSGVLIRRSRPIPRSHLRSRSADKIDRRVRTLRKLIPTCNQSTETMAMDSLFRDTADYILSLQTKVRAMQLMVNALTTNS